MSTEVTRFTRRWHTHGFLWIGARHQLSLAKNTEEGSYYTSMAAMLFAYLTMEAHINHIGAILFPKEWANERWFRWRRFRGARAKIHFLSFYLRTAPLPRDAYRQTLRLRRIRDRLSHGHTIEVSGTRTSIRGERAKLPSPGDSISVENASRSIEAVSTFCTYLHGRALASARWEDLRHALGPTFSSQLEETSQVTGAST